MALTEEEGKRGHSNQQQQQHDDQQQQQQQQQQPFDSVKGSGVFDSKAASSSRRRRSPHVPLASCRCRAGVSARLREEYGSIYAPTTRFWASSSGRLSRPCHLALETMSVIMAGGRRSAHAQAATCNAGAWFTASFLQMPFCACNNQWFGALRARARRSARCTCLLPCFAHPHALTRSCIVHTHAQSSAHPLASSAPAYASIRMRSSSVPAACLAASNASAVTKVLSSSLAGSLTTYPPLASSRPSSRT